MATMNSLQPHPKRNVARKSTANRPLKALSDITDTNTSYEGIVLANALHTKKLQELTKNCLSSRYPGTTTYSSDVFVKPKNFKDEPNFAESKYSIYTDSSDDSEVDECIDGVFRVSEPMKHYINAAMRSPPYFSDDSDEPLDPDSVLFYPIEIDYPPMEINSESRSLQTSSQISYSKQVELPKCNVSVKLPRAETKSKVDKCSTNGSDSVKSNSAKSSSGYKCTKSGVAVKPNAKSTAKAHASVKIDPVKSKLNNKLSKVQTASNKRLPNKNAPVTVSKQFTSNSNLNDSQEMNNVLVETIELEIPQESEVFVHAPVSFDSSNDNSESIQDDVCIVPKILSAVTLTDDMFDTEFTDSAFEVIQPEPEDIHREPVKEEKISKPPKRKGTGRVNFDYGPRKRTRSSAKLYKSLQDTNLDPELSISEDSREAEFEVHSDNEDLNVDTSENKNKSSVLTQSEEKLLHSLLSEYNSVLSGNIKCIQNPKSNDSSPSKEENKLKENSVESQKKSETKKSSGSLKKEINEGVLLHIEAVKKSDIMQDGRLLKDKKELIKDIESVIEKNLPVEVNKDFDIQQSLTEEILLDQALRLANQRTSPRRRPLLSKSQQKAVLNLLSEQKYKTRQSDEKKPVKGKSNVEEDVKHDSEESNSQTSAPLSKTDPGKQLSKAEGNSQNSVKNNKKKSTKKSRRLSVAKNNNKILSTSQKNENANESSNDEQHLDADDREIVNGPGKSFKSNAASSKKKDGNLTEDEEIDIEDTEEKNKTSKAVIPKKKSSKNMKHPTDDEPTHQEDPKENNKNTSLLSTENLDNTQSTNSVTYTTRTLRSRKVSSTNAEGTDLEGIEDNCKDTPEFSNAATSRRSSRKTRSSSINAEETHLDEIDENLNDIEDVSNKIIDNTQSPSAGTSRRKSRRNRKPSADNEENNKNSDECLNEKLKNTLNSNSSPNSPEGEIKKLPVLVIARRQCRKRFTIAYKNHDSGATETNNLEKDDSTKTTSGTVDKDKVLPQSPCKTCTSSSSKSQISSENEIDANRSTEQETSSKECLQKTKHLEDTSLNVGNISEKTEEKEGEGDELKATNEKSTSGSKTKESLSNPHEARLEDDKSKRQGSLDNTEVVEVDASNVAAQPSIPFLDGSESAASHHSDSCSDMSIENSTLNASIESGPITSPLFSNSTVYSPQGSFAMPTQSVRPPLLPTPGFPYSSSLPANVASTMSNSESNSKVPNASTNFNHYTSYSPAMPIIATKVTQMSPLVSSSSIQPNYQFQMGVNSVSSNTFSNVYNATLQNSTHSTTNLQAYSSPYGMNCPQTSVIAPHASTVYSASCITSNTFSATVYAERSRASKTPDNKAGETKETPHNVVPFSVLTRDPRYRSRDCRVLVNGRVIEIQAGKQEGGGSLEKVDKKNPEDKLFNDNEKNNIDEGINSHDVNEDVNSHDVNDSVNSHDDNENEKSKRRLKIRKEVDEELVYKTPLSDLHDKDDRTSYSRTLPRKPSRYDSRKDSKRSWRGESSYNTKKSDNHYHKDHLHRDHHDDDRIRSDDYRDDHKHRYRDDYHHRYRDDYPHDARDDYLHDHRNESNHRYREYNDDVPRRSDYYTRSEEFSDESSRMREFPERRPSDHPSEFRRSSYRRRDSSLEGYQRSQDYRRQDNIDHEYRRKSNDNPNYARFDYAHKKVDANFLAEAEKLNKNESHHDGFEDESEVRDLIEGPVPSGSVAPFYRRRHKSSSWRQSHLQDDDRSTSPYDTNLFERRRGLDSWHVEEPKLLDEELINGPTVAYEKMRYGREERSKSPRRDYEMYEKKRSRSPRRVHEEESPMSPPPEIIPYSDPKIIC